VQITFLGTGTSHGIPMIGCKCAVCTSADPRDRRCRASILVTQDDGTVVLVDTGADLRMQALTWGVECVDAVVYTHSHADHIFGLDELRRFNVLRGGDIPLYADEPTLSDLQRIFSYAFWSPPELGGGVPRLAPHLIDGPFDVGTQRWQPVPILHGRRPILGFRVGGFAYLTDCSGIPEQSWPLLDGLEVLVLGALRVRPHPTHFCIDEAVEVARRVGAARTLFTHMAHDLPHAATCDRLPPTMALAYDGLSVTVPALSPP
jgi:phosphoribosyl 1,2-cyclic phosphate phosphodiesterase